MKQHFSPARRRPRQHLLLTLLLALGLFAGCNGCERTETEPPPWRFTSESAPYEVIFPGTWRQESKTAINPYADLAASLDDTLFFMVIPQELPSFPRPDVFQLQRTALELLNESVENFVIERQGPIELDGVAGLSVFASGQLGEREIRYITSYVVKGDFGYQLIAFTEVEFEESLIREMDVVLSNWHFQRPESAPPVAEDASLETEESEELQED